MRRRRRSGMVLAHYGRWVALDELRTVCRHVPRRNDRERPGARAAEQYGCTAEGYGRSPARLEELGWPLIAFWEGNHFVVLEGRDRDGGYWLNDPANGHRHVTAERFDRSYGRVVLAIRPGPGFEPGGSAPKPSSALFSRLRPLMAAVLAVFTIAALLVVPGVGLALLSKIFVDEVLVGGDQSAAPELIIGLLAVIAVQAALTWYRTRAPRRVAHLVARPHRVGVRPSCAPAPRAVLRRPIGARPHHPRRSQRAGRLDTDRTAGRHRGCGCRGRRLRGPDDRAAAPARHRRHRPLSHQPGGRAVRVGAP